ncbi:MAG: hypothetical protein JNJ54_03715 [Myxococcaceae bacterium]|nr:hypothetical protein [Myxococcaceae bacterium]
MRFLALLLALAAGTAFACNGPPSNDPIAGLVMVVLVLLAQPWLLVAGLATAIGVGLLLARPAPARR